MKETTNNQSDSVAIPTLEANLGKPKLEVPHEHYAVGFFQKHCWEFLPAEVVGLGPHPQEDSQVWFENLQQKHLLLQETIAMKQFVGVWPQYLFWVFS